MKGLSNPYATAQVMAAEHQNAADTTYFYVTRKHGLCVLYSASAKLRLFGGSHHP